MLARAAPPLSRWERAGGLAIGLDRPSAIVGVTRTDARSVLEDVVGAETQRGQCAVSFSGGRDSSAVLALAVAAARRLGTDLPIPITLRFPHIANAAEADWQEQVVHHLGLGDWERIDITNELDLVGDVALDGLRRHGQPWPPNAHFHVPIFNRAAGRTVLTGFDGDGLFSGWRWWRSQAALHRRVRSELRDIGRISLSLAPTALRRAVVRRGADSPASWLRPEARRIHADMLAGDHASQPRRWDRWLGYYRRLRHIRLPMASLALLAADHGARVAHPLADDRFLSALARQGGAVGYPDRISALTELVGDLLPREVIERTSKAEFGRAFWGPASRAFAEQWDGSGVDLDLVDPDALRAVWREENPAFGAATVLQGTWLAANRTSQAADGSSTRGSPETGGA